MLDRIPTLLSTFRRGRSFDTELPSWVIISKSHLCFGMKIHLNRKSDLPGAGSLSALSVWTAPVPRTWRGNRLLRSSVASGRCDAPLPEGVLCQESQDHGRRQGCHGVRRQRAPRRLVPDRACSSRQVFRAERTGSPSAEGFQVLFVPAQVPVALCPGSCCQFVGTCSKSREENP